MFSFKSNKKFTMNILQENQDKIKKDIKYKLDLKADPPDERDYKLAIPPEKKYLTEYGVVQIVDHSSQMSPVKDQGEFGSCVAFALAALKEWQEKKEFVFEKYVLDKPKERTIDDEYDFSEQWIYYQTKKIDKHPEEEGLSIRDGLKILHKIGVPVEQAWIYTEGIDIGKPEKWAHLVARWNKIGAYYRIRTMQELKNALIDSPVILGIAVFDEMMDPGESGYITMPRDLNLYYGGHAICVVGFDETTKLFKFKNSWGTDWGSDGYGFLPYEYIENFTMDAWACKDMRITKADLKGKQDEMFLY